MEMDCIPAGMELFPAADDEQWAFIKRVIDDCDYYLLILGGRYGSVGLDGISYTEKEYDYAVQKHIKVLSFVHEAPDEISVAKSDIDPALREKLGNFRTKVCANKLVKFWRLAPELPGLVALSLSKTIKAYPAIGWMRADQTSNSELLADLNVLRKENESLRTLAQSLEAKSPPGDVALAGLDELFSVNLKSSYHTQYGHREERETVSISWGELFTLIAPMVQEHPADMTMESSIAKAVYRKFHPTTSRSVEIDHQDFLTIRVQLAALDLVATPYSMNTAGGASLFWNLTSHGNRVMMQLRTVKRR